MRRIFLSWLLLVMLIVFCLTMGGAYVHLMRHAEDLAAQRMETRLRDLMELIRHAEESTRHVTEVNDAGNIQRARALAELIRLNPALLHNQEALQGVCNDLGALQISVADENGIVQAAVPASHVGYSLGDHDQSRAFMACIDDPDCEISQRPRANGSEHEMMQYAGVHRRDARGVVQLGVLTAHEQALRANASFGKLAAHYQLGNNGRIIAIRGGEVLNPGTVALSASELLGLPLEKATEISIENGNFFAYATEQNGYRLVGLLPIAEIYGMAWNPIRTVLITGAVLLVIMMTALSFLLYAYVLRPMRRVNDTLHHIADGDLNERVDVGGSPEMLRLSTDLNAMVDALQFYADEKRESMKHSLELARNIQMAVMPAKFPAFPHREEFDLYALCAPAMTVGGDFYDFFLIDEDHLGFTVGDSSRNGIPAALYMMRCMAVTRAVARTGAEPAEVVTETNKALTGMESGEIEMSLFYGSLEISTGRLRYVNAGTPQVYLQHSGGTFEPVELVAGMVLGVYDSAAYKEGVLQLAPGDRLFLYTEGVVNAADAENTPFGADRLRETLNTPAARIADVPLQVRSAVRRFLQDAEPREDITMFALEYRGMKRTEAERSFTAAQTEQMGELLDAVMQDVLAAPDDIEDMKACAFAVLNAMEPELVLTARLCCTEKEAELSLRYAGPRSNPMVGLPHLPVNDVRYSYGTENLLTLRKVLA